MPRVKRSPYAKLPYDARLLVRFLEILFPEQNNYAEGARYPSRAFKAAMRVLAPGSEEVIKFSGFPGIWYVKSQSRPTLERWYITNLEDMTCEVDTARLVIPPGLKIDESHFFCEDRHHHKAPCYHLLVAALAEAVRIDAKDIPTEQPKESKEDE